MGAAPKVMKKKAAMKAMKAAKVMKKSQGSEQQGAAHSHHRGGVVALYNDGRVLLVNDGNHSQSVGFGIGRAHQVHIYNSFIVEGQTNGSDEGVGVKIEDAHVEVALRDSTVGSHVGIVDSSEDNAAVQSHINAGQTCSCMIESEASLVGVNAVVVLQFANSEGVLVCSVHSAVKHEGGVLTTEDHILNLI